MQEFAILLSSLAGVATAAAVRKMPRNKTQLLSLGASSHIKNQINSLNIEKDILTKIIARLYQSDSELTKIQRDKLLLKYQHQLGIILAKLEKLEAASHHPDLGPVGDGLITLMDQKLSKLDDRLFELSSKIQTKEVPKVEHIEKQKEKTVKPKTESKPTKTQFKFDKPVSSEPIVIPPTKPKQSFELTTLTRFSKKEPSFPLFDKKTATPKEEIIEEIIQPKPKVEDKIEIVQTVSVPKPVIETKPELGPKPDLSKEVAKITEHKALPTPEGNQLEKEISNDIDDDVDDLEKIKGEIMKTLSKLEQAEVE